MAMWRSRWAATGAAVAVSIGAGGLGLGLAHADISAGDRPVTVTIAPQRILDTRVDLGLPGRFVSQTPRDLQVTGNVPVASGGTATVVPSGAVAVLVNVTVVRPDNAGYLTLRPSGSTGVPTTSTVNFSSAGSVEPNAATVDLGSGGTVQIYLYMAVAAGTADVLVDVVGYTVDHDHDDRYYTETQTESLVSDAIASLVPVMVPFDIRADVGETVTIASSGPLSLELECTSPIGGISQSRVLGGVNTGLAVMLPGHGGTNSFLASTTPANDRVVKSVSTNVPWFERLDSPGALLTHDGHYLAIGTETLVGVNWWTSDCRAVGAATRLVPVG